MKGKLILAISALLTTFSPHKDRAIIRRHDNVVKSATIAAFYVQVAVDKYSVQDVTVYIA